ncbi:Hypothetical predicted protein [Olea europaea subsp. europaea]|uniref:Uncharacterized protein n=1 Tax=Olea europaea subsp. europaea TaxID=158383 RepID=A0A8S0UD49_OLEEU|nr:Hypothetical predicted protein [Olea europaea subsp. europaea]
MGATQSVGFSQHLQLSFSIHPDGQVTQVKNVAGKSTNRNLHYLFTLCTRLASHEFCEGRATYFSPFV